MSSWTDGDSRVDVFPAPHAPFSATVPWLFFHRENLLFQSSDVIYSFILTSKESAVILAVFHCLSGIHEWISPPSAPFGGVLPLQPCSEARLAFLLRCAREWIAQQGGQSIVIKTAPACYAPTVHETCHRSYVSAGFFPNHTYSNHYIPIAGEAFMQIIEPPERRRLSKGKKSGLLVTVDRGIFRPELAQLLFTCFAQHHYRLSLSAERLTDLAHHLAADMLVFSAWQGAAPKAVLIAVKVSDKILYTFVSAYLEELRSLSPSLLLFEAAYDYCRGNGIDILDLGISLDHHGNHKPSLARFKKNIGGRECVKIIYKALL
ncbi:MAG: GNAT family N-acetyltransferase [Dyadobacter fermentans]